MTSAFLLQKKLVSLGYPVELIIPFREKKPTVRCLFLSLRLRISSLILMDENVYYQGPPTWASTIGKHKVLPPIPHQITRYEENALARRNSISLSHIDFLTFYFFTFQVIAENPSGLLFKNKRDRKILNVDPKVRCSFRNRYWTCADLEHFPLPRALPLRRVLPLSRSFLPTTPPEVLKFSSPKNVVVFGLNFRKYIPHFDRSLKWS